MLFRQSISDLRRRQIETPSSRLQAPEKHQASNSKNENPVGGHGVENCFRTGNRPLNSEFGASIIGIWSFSGAWMLEFGIFPEV